jgi:hypothetical protein
LASTTISAESRPTTACAILSVRPNVSREDALEILGGSDVSTMFWRIRKGRLQTVADAYVPYRFFRVQMTGRSASLTHIYAIDSVIGSLDPYEFASVPDPQSLARVETRNYMATALTEEQAQSRLRERVLRMIFQRGFFKVRTPDLKLESLATEVYLPYWLGFYGHGRNRQNEQLRCRVIDAVRRRVEGAKARAFFESWIAAK